MVNGSYIAVAYAKAIENETFTSKCIRGRNGEIMTQTASSKMQCLKIFSSIIVMLVITAIGFILAYPEQFKEMDNDSIICVIIFFLTAFVYLLFLIWVRVRGYKEYYLREEGVVIKRGFSEKIISYESLIYPISQWKPLIYKGKVVLIAEEKLVVLDYGNMTGGVAFMLLLLQILGDETKKVEDFWIMYQPGHWKEKREAKKELKKRKQYVKRNKK